MSKPLMVYSEGKSFCRGDIYPSGNNIIHRAEVVVGN